MPPLASCCKMMNSRISLAVRRGLSIITECPQFSRISTLHWGNTSLMTMAPETSTTWTNTRQSHTLVSKRNPNTDAKITWSCLPHITCKGAVIRCKCSCKAYLDFSSTISINTVKGKTESLRGMEKKQNINFYWNAFSTRLTFLVKCVVRLTNINQPLKNLNKTRSDRKCSCF